MSLDEGISRLIKRIYCANGDPAEWDRIAKEVLRYTGGRAALTTLVDLANRKFDTYRFYGPETSPFARGLEEYEHTHHIDPSLAWACRNPLARFCASESSVETGDYLDHPFVRWNQCHFGSTHWYVGFTPPAEQVSYSFSVLFPEEQGPGSPAALRLFRMLFDHMECAIWLGRRPFNPDSDAAYVLLDSGGYVRELSRGAQRLIDANDGLEIYRHRLTPSKHADRAQLELAMARVTSACATGAGTTGVKLSRPSGRRPLLLTIKPLINDAGPFGKAHCELLVHIHDGQRKIASLHLVQALFELTHRETEVLGHLTQGHTLETLSACMKISANTARAHLRSIFAKTGTCRQSELLHLSAEIAAD